VKYCPECGHQLDRGTEKFCPECGEKLGQAATSGGYDNKNGSIGITETKGDVFGVDTSGSNNVSGKGLAYTRQGTAIVININNPSSKDTFEIIKNIAAVPTQVQQTPLAMKTISDIDVKAKLEESINSQQQIKSITEEVDKIEKKEGTKIEEIRAGELRISIKELLVKEIMLKGDEHYYREEYSEAIKWYDKVIEIDPNYVVALCNKGMALLNLGKYKQAIEWYDKALAVDSEDVFALRQKGWALYNLGKYKQAIEWYDKALALDPNNIIALDSKGEILMSLRKYNHAIRCFDKALAINPNYTYALNDKGLSLYNLGKYKQALEYFDSALAVDPSFIDSSKNRRLVLLRLKTKP
jgi:tetratricopeptide (TPR) repeat protein